MSGTDVPVDSYGAQEEAVEVVEEEEAAPDLGWLAPPEPKKKRKGKAVAVVEEEEEDDEEERMEEARVSGTGGPSPTRACLTLQEHRMELLGNLSALLGRVRLLRQAEARLETTKGLMGKGGARKVREEGFVDDENAPEDRNGERKKFVGKQWKWKLERRK